jgi:membrane fusion protein, multidrug efflux system
MRFASLAFIFAFVLTGCGSSTVHQSGTNESAIAGAPLQVAVVSVESEKLDTNLELPAQITAYEVVDVYPKVTGFIDAILVDRGSHVKAGDVIARLSAPELVSQRTQAEAALHGAEAQLAAAQAKFASDHGTFLHLQAAAQTPGVVAGNDLQVAEQVATADKAQLEAASNTVQAARENVRSVTQLESYLEIRAPFEGVVTQRNLHPGALVGPTSGPSGAQPIVQIESIGRLRVIVPVPEAYAAGVRDGQQVSFSVPAFPGRNFHAPVARISHDITQSTRTMQVELDLQNAGFQITPGTFASVVWPIRRSDETLFVPSTAVTTDLQRTFVIRVRQGKTEWVDVKTGTTVNGKIEVFGSLQAGDVVVANATDSIRNGTAISPQAK